MANVCAVLTGSTAVAAGRLMTHEARVPVNASRIVLEAQVLLAADSESRLGLAHDGDFNFNVDVLGTRAKVGVELLLSAASGALLLPRAGGETRPAGSGSN